MVEEADQIFSYQILGGSGYTDLAGFLLKLDFTKMCRDGPGEDSRAWRKFGQSKNLCQGFTEDFKDRGDVILNSKYFSSLPDLESFNSIYRHPSIYY